MAFEAEQGIVAAHAAAVIGHPDERPPTGTDLDDNACGSGIERILNQFLDHTGRALDDLTGRNLVGNLLWKQVNPIHPQRLSPETSGR